MPASTCWQWRAAVRAPRPAMAFAIAAVDRRAGRARRRRARASAVSMATSVSASRWRTAWNCAIGWPNWTRSRACSRASSSIVRDAPTSSWPTASWASGDGGAPSRRGCGVGRRRPSPWTSTQAEVGIDAVDRPERRASACDHDGDVPVAGRGDDERRRPVDGRAGRATRDAVAVELPGRLPAPSAGSTTAVVAVELATERVGDDVVERRRRRAGRALELEQRATPRRAGRSPSASCQPSSAERGVERRRRCAARSACAQAALEQLEVVAVRSSVVPEVEQAAGDDVALDLGAAAVDRRRPRVEELACATARCRRRRRS